MRSRLRSAHSRATACRYSGVAGHTPPSPWTHSSMTAHAAPTPFGMASSRLVRAAASLSGTSTKPAGSGWKSRWKLSWPVAASVASVRPWKLCRAVTIVLAPPRWVAPQRLASLMAPSFASAPEFAKNVFHVVPVVPVTWPCPSHVDDSRRDRSWASSPRFWT